MNLAGIYQVYSVMVYFEDSPKMISKEDRINMINASNVDAREKQQELMIANGLMIYEKFK